MVSLPSTGEIEWFVPLAEPRRPLSGSTGLKPASVHGPMSSVTGTGPNVRRIPVEETFLDFVPIEEFTTPDGEPMLSILVVAAGEVRLQSRIIETAPELVHRGYQRVLEYAWLDEATRDLLRQAEALHRDLEN